MRKFVLFFTFMLVLGLAVRVWGLSARPVGFTWDEAALGYNAYSMLLTGRDEHGQVAPVVFKSFGDYKPGLYIYFSVLPTALLGLNEFSTRLPSAVFGVLTIAVIYVLARLLFPQNKTLAPAALVVSALNPWLIHFSRGAWEANLSLFLTVTGVTLFLWFTRRGKTSSLFLSALCFGLTFWTYQGAKMFTPLLLFALAAIYVRKEHLRRLIIPVVLGLVLLLPILLGLSGQAGRLKVFSVFSYTRSVEFVSELLHQDNVTGRNWLYYLYHSELLDQLRGVSQRYLNHLSPRFLFSEGDWANLRQAEYKHGYFYFVDVLCLVLGFVYLARNGSKSTLLIMAWLLLAPLPAAFSRDLVSGVRSLPLSIPIILVISAGVSGLLRLKLSRLIYLSALAAFVVYFSEFYFFHAGFYAADVWVSPYKQAVSVISTHLSDYSHVHFTDELGQPYIFVLYYLRYDPALFQSQALRQDHPNGDVGKVTGFGNFSFGPVFWPSLRGKSDFLTIGGRYELPEKDLQFAGLTRISDITYPNGVLAFRVVGVH